MATVAEGIYLEDNPPVLSQFRVGRRDPVRSVIVVHTAESGTTTDGPDPKAENVASFIRNRTGAGSYHLIGDADSIIQLVDFANEAFGDRTGSNRWAIHISLAMNAADWLTLPSGRAAELVDTAGQMAAIAAAWLSGRGLVVPAPYLLTKAESDRADRNGFISHARRDPTRRSDPGPSFPWAPFFDAYERHLIEQGTNLMSPANHTADLQRRIAAEGYARAWWDNHTKIDPDDTTAVDRYADGDLGPATLADFTDMADALNEASFDPSLLAKATALDNLIAAHLEALDAVE